MEQIPIPKFRKHLPIFLRLPMKLKHVSVGIFLGVLAPQVVNAQIIPDQSLPINSRVQQQGDTELIQGGTVRSSKLFHSFEAFSVPKGYTAHFNNSSTIKTIFGRVTGETASSIDGTLKSNGTADLFLLNPNGILFGPNSKLDLGGSFLATTADSFRFADGMEFGANSKDENPPLLSINVPTGLKIGSNPGPIKVVGPGHELVTEDLQLYGAGQSTTGLRVQPGKSLALVGGNVGLDGGILTSPGGRIEVGSVGSGLVDLILAQEGWTLGYSKVSKFRDIDFSTRSLIDTSGFAGGLIQVLGRKVNSQDGSVILSQSLGLQSAAPIKVGATDSIQISGTDPIARIIGGIFTSTLGDDPGGNIFITTPRLRLQEGGTLSTITYGFGKAGDITLDVIRSVDLVGRSPLTQRSLSSIFSLSFGPGPSGNILANTGRFTATNGSSVFSNTVVLGKGGNITLNASEQVELLGTDESNGSASSLIVATTGRGDTGRIAVNTPRLSLRDGGSIVSSTLASGNAAEISINAPELVEILGGTTNPSSIASSATVASETQQRVFGLPGPEGLTGRSGTTGVNTKNLVLRDGGQSTVRNDGKGPAGDIQANADFLTLDRGSITATTQQGEGGNIKATVSDTVLLRNNSSITASAKGKGPGGNVDIDPKLVVLLENSSISANAEKGPGGKVSVTTEGLFISPDSEITATSDRGPQFDGIVELNTPELDLSRATSEPETLPKSPQIISTCQSSSQTTASEYIDAGRGGLPPKSPNSLQSSNIGWGEPENQPKSAAQVIEESSTSIVEAQGWKSNGDGTVSFVVAAPDVVAYSSLNTPSCHRDAKKGESIGVQNHKPEPSRGNRN